MAQTGQVVFSSDPLVGHKQLYNNGADTHFSVHIISGAFPTTRYKIKSVVARFTLRNATWATIEIWAHSVHLGSFGEAGANGERTCGLTTGFDYKTLSQVDFYGGSDGSQLASGSTVTVTVTWELTDVPTTVTVTPKADVGAAVTATLNAAVSSYRHKLIYQLGNKTATAELASGVKTHTLTIPMDWCEAIPDALSGGARVKVETYEGNRFIGARTAPFTVSVPASVTPTVTGFTIDPTEQKLGLTLQGISGLLMKATAVGAYGSTIKTIRFTADGRSISGTPATFTKIQSSGAVPCSLLVTDSRGRKASDTKTFTVTAYQPPELTEIKQERCAADGTADRRGNRMRWKVQTVWTQLTGNALTLVIERQNGANWERLYSGEPKTDWQLPTQVFDTTKPYTIRYTLADSVTTAQPLTVRLPAGYTYLLTDPARQALGFGTYPQHEKSFEVEENTAFYTHGKEIAAWMGTKSEKTHSHSVATQSAAGMMSAADKTKLDSLSVNSLQNLTSQVTQNTACRKLTVTRFGKVVTLSIQSQQKSWASGQTIITLPNAAKPAGELDIPFVMGAAGQGIFRIRTDGVCVCAAVSTNESKSIMTTITYLAAN